MTPYNDRSLVMIDPNIPNGKLLFGELPIKHYKEIGTIQERKYMQAKKCTTYAVKFETSDIIYWFKETELVVILSR